MNSWTQITPFPSARPVAMQQHPNYGATCKFWRRQVIWLGFKTQPCDPITATAQVLIRHWPGLGKIALVSRGPVWHDDQMSSKDKIGAARGLAKLLRQTYRGVIFTPEPVAQIDPFKGARLLKMMSCAHVGELTLNSDMDHMRQRMRGKWRNRLCHAEAAGLDISITSLPPDPHHWLLRLEMMQAKALHYQRLPPAFAAAWVAANPKDAKVICATKNGSIVAAILILIHAPTASYHIAWSSDRGKALSATNFCLWHGMKYLAERGIQRLDMDVINTQDAPGLARFKLGAGATARPLAATWVSAPGTQFFADLSAFGSRLVRPNPPSQHL